MLAHGKPERRGSWIRSLAALSALLVVGSCGGSGTTDLQAHPEIGTYHLLTVNGQSLPVTITNTSLGTVVIQSATVVLAAASTTTYTASITGVASGAPATTLVNDAGTYVRSGSTLTFTSSNVLISFAGTINDANGHIVVALPGPAIGAPLGTTLQLELAKS